MPSEGLGPAQPSLHGCCIPTQQWLASPGCSGLLPHQYLPSGWPVQYVLGRYHTYKLIVWSQELGRVPYLGRVLPLVCHELVNVMLVHTGCTATTELSIWPLFV